MKKYLKKKKSYALAATIVGVFCLGLSAGWLILNSFYKHNSEITDSDPLRLSGGYQYISPLLVCDTYVEKKYENYDSIEKDINRMIDEYKNQRKVNTISIYYRDLSSGKQININPEEKYFPASLNKVPFMIAYLKYAVSNTDVLTQKVKVENNIPVTNNLQEIIPEDEAKIGESYTVEELISKMIKYSDNNSFYALANHLDRKYFDSTYTDFNIAYPEDQSDKPDFITTYDFSYFLRVLYNATYLKRDLSEKALKYMSEVNFKDGIVAGVPRDTKVSHKFGLRNDVDSSGKTVNRELHDCGIVYRENDPYLLCIMTKSGSEIAQISDVVKSISEYIYRETSNKDN